MKVLVAHPAQQHSYRLGTALKRAGMLDKYATTVYYKSGSLTACVAKLLRAPFRTKAEARYCDALGEEDVIQFCEAEGLLKLLVMHLPVVPNYYYRIKYHTADRFAKKAAKYAIKHHVDAVVTYDDTSPLLFEILREKAPNILRVLDMSSASLPYLRKIYERDLELAPAFAERMRKERSICWDPKVLDRAKREIEATQRFLVPSDFVERSLADSGVLPDQIYRCPYGVDAAQFSPKEYPDDMTAGSRPVRFIYVGGVKELKGISYLLDAFMELPADAAELTIVGGYHETDRDIAPYRERVRFTGTMIHSTVAEELKRADVFILASLGEGLSLSTLEAAGCGLPLIVTENSGVNDVMSNGVEGFVIPIQSKAAVKEKMLWFIDHPERIKPMGQAARAMALKYTWDAYDQRIGDIFTQMAGSE